MISLKNTALFLGLTHIGQVFSLGWASKFRSAAVYDTDLQLLKNFKNGNITTEEPKLDKFYHKNKKKLLFLKKKEDIKYFKNIFFTYDTPLDSEGKPQIIKINKKLKEIINFVSPNTNLIILSQVPCGFCDNLFKNLCEKKNINLIYMVDTLIMGSALESFLRPSRLIFGINKKTKFFNNFKKFSCPIFFLKFQEAELVKISINLYLFTNVTFANCMDYYCREKNFKFRDINKAIKLDKRIGINSYLNPSLGISGGHLERDLFTTTSSTKNNYVKIFYNALKKVNDSRFNLLVSSYNSRKLLVNFNKIIWIGVSYKKDSFSIKNSPFLKFQNFLKKERKVLNSYDSIYDISNLNYQISSLFFLKKKKKYLLIYNYSNDKDKKNLKNTLSKNKNIICLDISLNNSLFKKNFQNYENLL